MTDTNIISLFLQLPVVGIFVWFIFKWTDKLDKALAVRQADQTRSDEKRDETFLAFLREERQHRVDSNTRFANELKDISDTLSAIQAVTISHDARASQYIDGRIKEDQEH